MKLLTQSLLGAGALGLALAAIPASNASAAPVIVNGSFSNVGTATTSFGITASNLPGWTTTSTYSFLVFPGQATTGFPSLTLYSFPATSPDGGNFVLQDGNYGAGTLSQTLTGLTVGASYAVSFYQASGQQTGFTGATTEDWLVSLTPSGGGTGSSQRSTVMNTPSQSSTPWTLQTLNFVATAASEVLGFMAEGTPNGAPPFVGLDGVSISGTTVAVSEPGTVALLGLAGLALVAVRKQRKQRS